MGVLDTKPMADHENAWFIYNLLHIVSKTIKMCKVDFFRLSDKEKWKKVRQLVVQSSKVLYAKAKLGEANDSQ